MNPSLVRELDAEAAAIVRALDDLPPGQARDLSGHIDGKKAIMRRVERLAKRWREGIGAGETGPVKQPVPRFVETLEIKRRASK